MNKLSEIIKHARLEKELTKREIASQVGCKISELENLENGIGGREGVPPMHYDLWKIGELLDIDPILLFESMGEWKPKGPKGLR